LTPVLKYLTKAAKKVIEARLLRREERRFGEKLGAAYAKALRKTMKMKNLTFDALLRVTTNVIL